MRPYDYQLKDGENPDEHLVHEQRVTAVTAAQVWVSRTDHAWAVTSVAQTAGAVEMKQNWYAQPSMNQPKMRST
jgi:hypothetical protein